MIWRAVSPNSYPIEGTFSFAAGHRRVHSELVKQGGTIAKKTLLKLMRLLRLVGKVQRKKRYNSCQGEQGSWPRTC
ncbi:IS3 family transposase [Arthrobacter sp. NPDC058288]|uniref:IS3 family transposase n=1 Tax=Arthrobacter sp. NPDC058288 TaxID=3346424 RepID=UPI0036EF63F1